MEGRTSFSRSFKDSKVNANPRVKKEPQKRDELDIKIRNQDLDVLVDENKVLVNEKAKATAYWSDWIPDQELQGGKVRIFNEDAAGDLQRECPSDLTARQKGSENPLALSQNKPDLDDEYELDTLVTNSRLLTESKICQGQENSAEDEENSNLDPAIQAELDKLVERRKRARASTASSASSKIVISKLPLDKLIPYSEHESVFAAQYNVKNRVRSSRPSSRASSRQATSRRKEYLRQKAQALKEETERSIAVTQRQKTEAFQARLRKIERERAGFVREIEERIDAAAKGQQRMKEKLYQKWRAQVFVKIQSQVENQMKSVTPEQISERRRAKFDEYIRASNKKLIYLEVLDDEYDPFSSSSISYKVANLDDPTNAVLTKKQEETKIAKLTAASGRETTTTIISSNSRNSRMSRATRNVDLGIDPTSQWREKSREQFLKSSRKFKHHDTTDLTKTITINQDESMKELQLGRDGGKKLFSDQKFGPTQVLPPVSKSSTTITTVKPKPAKISQIPMTQAA